MIIGILGPGGVGGTFLDWSLQFLSGNDQHLVITVDRKKHLLQNIETLPVVDDPMQSNTAHTHKKTHPNDFTLDQCLSVFRKDHAHWLNTFYYVDSMHPKRTKTNHDQIITANPDINFIEFVFSTKEIDRIFCNQIEKIMDFSLLQFQKNIYQEKNKKLEIWDLRETLSMYYPKCVSNQLTFDCSYQQPNQRFLIYDVFLKNFDDVVRDLFASLQIPVSTSRYQNWKNIYDKWKRTNSQDFFNDLNLILNDIVNGQDRDLSGYKMTFAKEVIISKHLLFDFNLSLRTHGIDKMPLNTTGWYDLLEPNVYHDLSESK